MAGARQAIHTDYKGAFFARVNSVPEEWEVCARGSRRREEQEKGWRRRGVIEGEA
jgi:hypothetical protein